MAIDIYDAVNGDGLFQIQGKGFHAIDVLNAARLTTVPVEVEDFLAQHKLLEGADLSFSQVTDGVAAAVNAHSFKGRTLKIQGNGSELTTL